MLQTINVLTYLLLCVCTSHNVSFLETQLMNISVTRCKAMSGNSVPLDFFIRVRTNVKYALSLLVMPCGIKDFHRSVTDDSGYLRLRRRISVSWHLERTKCLRGHKLRSWQRILHSFETSENIYAEVFRYFPGVASKKKTRKFIQDSFSLVEIGTGHH
jgi:hypothetical protein